MLLSMPYPQLQTSPKHHPLKPICFFERIGPFHVGTGDGDDDGVDGCMERPPYKSEINKELRTKYKNNLRVCDIVEK